MERIKSVLADKIIDVASEGGDLSKVNLEKLNRFRDFIFACEALMKKYPRIEDELIGMIESNDFDTRLASSKVNGIIALVEGGGSSALESDEVSVLPPVVGEDAVGDNGPTPLPDPSGSLGKVVEDELIGTSGDQTGNYVSSENVEFEYSVGNKVSLNLRRIVIVLAVVAGVVFAYFAIKFIIRNWEIILVVIGIIAALGGLLWFLASKKNNNEIE